MVRRLFCVLLIVSLIAGFMVPCFASDNTIGDIFTEVDFIGFSYGADSWYKPMLFGVDGFINKRLTGSSYVGIEPYFYYYFNWPSNASDMTVSVSVSYAATYIGGYTFNWYGVHRVSGEQRYERTLVGTGFFNGQISNVTGYSSVCVTSPVLVNDNFDALMLEIAGDANTTYLYLSQESTISLNSSGASGTVSIGSSASNYGGSGFDAAPYAYGFLKACKFSDTEWYIGFNEVWSLNAALPNITYSSAATSDTGIITTASATPYIATAEAFVLYGDDGGLVDEVFSIGDDVEAIADNMQTIVDDIQAQKDTASDIGSATSDDNISNTQETLSSGTASLNSGLSVAGDVASVSSPAGMYIGLMTATVTPMLNFGNGVLYWALFAILIGSVILFIFRRLQ